MWYVRDSACHWTCALASTGIQLNRKKRAVQQVLLLFQHILKRKQVGCSLLVILLPQRSFQKALYASPCNEHNQTQEPVKLLGKLYIPGETETTSPSKATWVQIQPQNKMTCLFSKKWMCLGNRMSKISDGINNRALHSGGSCPTLPQPQPSPLEYSCPDLQDFKGKFRFISAPFPPIQAELLSTNADWHSPVWIREGTENWVYVALHSSALPGTPPVQLSFQMSRKSVGFLIIEKHTYLA